MFQAAISIETGFDFALGANAIVKWNEAIALP